MPKTAKEIVEALKPGPKISSFVIGYFRGEYFILCNTDSCTKVRHFSDLPGDFDKVLEIIFEVKKKLGLDNSCRSHPIRWGVVVEYGGFPMWLCGKLLSPFPSFPFWNAEAAENAMETYKLNNPGRVPSHQLVLFPLCSQ